MLQKPNLTFRQLDDVFDASQGRLVVDFDDAIWMGYGPGDPSDGLESLHETLRRAALVITGSSYLATWASTVTDSPIEVLPPSVDVSRYQPVRAHNYVAQPVLVWVGSSGNFADFDAARPVLQELLGERAVRLRVVADEPLGPAQWPGAEWLPWASGPDVRALAESDIGLMPLRDNERTRGRCGYKAVQYAACALPTVASPVGGAAEVIVPGRTGFVATTQEEWLHVLRSLIDDTRLRAAVGERARALAEDRHSLEGNAVRLASLLRLVRERPPAP